MKQRREKAYQNAKDRKLAKGNLLAALKANCRANRASNDTQSSTNTNDELIDGSDKDTVIGVENTDNIAITAENTDNDATNAENIDNAAINADNTSNAATDSEKSDDAAMINDNTDNTTMSDDNTDNAAMSDNNTDDAATGNGNTENTKDPSKVKTSKKCMPIMVEP